MCHIHFGILKGVKVNGWPPTRPLVGIVVELRGEKGKRLLLEHNLRFSKGNHLLPPIHVRAHMVWYGPLAASHLSLALRRIKADITSPIGDLKSMVDDDENLRKVTLNGHSWRVLPEYTLVDQQQDTYVWINQDQNQNQQMHAGEILQTIKSAAEAMSKYSAKVTLADLVARVHRKAPSEGLISKRLGTRQGVLRVPRGGGG